MRQCDPCGPPTCCFSLPCLRCLHPIAWDGCCNDCGPSPCEPCGNYCGGCRDGLLAHCFLFGGLRGCMTCGKGCGEIYCDEWKSDPPDCCDPCDQCCGEYTGPHGYCCLGPCQRILACLDGYKYCPPPNCGPWRPIFGHCNPCPGPGCGDVGCSTCGGGPAHGADVYYNGPITSSGEQIRAPRGTSAPNSTPSPRAIPTPRTESAGIIEETEIPVRQARPYPTRPLPTNQQMLPYETSTRRPQPSMAARAAAAKKRAAYEAAGVRSANYER